MTRWSRVVLSALWLALKLLLLVVLVKTAGSGFVYQNF